MPVIHRATGLCDVGNQVPRYSGWKLISGWVSTYRSQRLETKYRDIADGNSPAHSKTAVNTISLETKYRDIADGNKSITFFFISSWFAVRNQVPRYSGYKSIAARGTFLPVRQFARPTTDKIKVGPA